MGAGMCSFPEHEHSYTCLFVAVFSFLLGKYQGLEWLNHRRGYVSKKFPNSNPKWPHSVTVSHSVPECSRCSAASPAVGLICLFGCRHSHGCEVHLTVVWFCKPPLAEKDDEHLSVNFCSFVSPRIGGVCSRLQISCPLCKWLIYLFSYSCRKSLYILDRHLCIVGIFSQPVDCVFIVIRQFFHLFY